MKLEINIGNQQVLFLVIFAAILLAIGITGAYNPGGTGGDPLIMGHSVDELDLGPIDVDVEGNINTSGNICANNGADCLKRIIYYAPKATRGTTTNIPESVIIDYCGDDNGCELRLGMYDWDGTGRTASRRSLFYYNKNNRNWRSELGDRQGTNNNGAAQHPMEQWACYFTDGKYNAWTNQGDPDANFGLLSWNQYTAECRLTIID